MSDTMKVIEYARIIAEKEFPDDYCYSSEARQMAIRNVLFAAQVCNDSPSNIIYDLEATVNELKNSEEPDQHEKSQEKQVQKPKTTELVRD